MNIRIIIKPLLLITVPTFLCYFIIKIIEKTSKNETDYTVSIPKLIIQNDQILIFSTQNLRINTPTVFVAFSSDCEHCQYEAKSINDKHKDLEKAQIIMFTSEKDSLTKVFAHAYGLDTLKNVQVISDEKNEMHAAFGVKSIPTIFIYDANGKLLKRYNGETKMEAILKTLD